MVSTNRTLETDKCTTNVILKFLYKICIENGNLHHKITPFEQQNSTRKKIGCYKI